MSPPAREPKRPLVALEVEPRLLRDALARALGGEGVTIVDLRDESDRCDILVSSDASVPAAVANLVVQVGPEQSSAAGPVSVTDLLALIRGWETAPAV